MLCYGRYLFASVLLQLLSSRQELGAFPQSMAVCNAHAERVMARVPYRPSKHLRHSEQSAAVLALWRLVPSTSFRVCHCRDFPIDSGFLDSTVHLMIV